MNEATSQMCRQIIANRTQQVDRQPKTTDDAPPPYSRSDLGSNDNDDNENSDDDDEDSASPISLTINAAHNIHGTGNIVPTATTTSSIATAISNALLSTIREGNTVSSSHGKVHLTINCGITIIGDRNVVGNVGLKLKSPASPVTGSGVMPPADANAVQGAKRKADEDVVEVPEAKRLAVRGAPDGN